MREAVVIGGTGFIGSYLVEALVQSGWRVRIVSRSGGTDRPHDGVSFVRAGVSDADALDQAIAGAEYVFHLATGGGSAWADFERDYITGTRAVAGSCLKHGVRRLIYTSSIAALDLGRNITVTETHGVDPRPEERGLYCRAKVAAEGILNEMHARQGLDVVILRPAVVVGPGGLLAHSGVGQWPSDGCCIGWGSGRNPLPLVLAEDVAGACVLAMTAEGAAGRTFNLSGDVLISAREYVERAAAVSMRNLRFYPQSLLKMQALEVMKWVLKCAARKADNPFPSYRDLKSRSLQTKLDCSAAKSTLGWRPNADREYFFQEAIGSHLTPVSSSDLRLAELPSVFS